MNDLEYKNLSFNLNADEEGEFEAIASNEEIDLFKDIVEVQGIQAEYPLPSLHEHKSNRQIGIITNGYIKDNQFYIQSKLDLKNEIKSDVSLNQRYTLRKLAQEGKMQLSIGYKPLEVEYKNINGEKIRVLKRIQLKEVSFTDNPVNRKTGFVYMKSADEIYNKGLQELDEFYKKQQEEREKISQQIKNDLLKIIKETDKREEFAEAIEKYIRFNDFYTKKQVNFIIDNSREFYKRVSEKYKQTETKSLNENKEIDNQSNQENSIYQWLIDGLKK